MPNPVLSRTTTTTWSLRGYVSQGAQRRENAACSLRRRNGDVWHASQSHYVPPGRGAFRRRLRRPERRDVPPAAALPVRRRHVGLHHQPVPEQVEAVDTRLLPLTRARH